MVYEATKNKKQTDFSVVQDNIAVGSGVGNCAVSSQSGRTESGE